ncbi:class I SAM-dependent methyltransferase [Pseudovibrio sp. Tun.PSC04-5.I4]|uniref:class I SAM-dependent methyltransferase n=1 Tax=Pseudovibrio sp. Tun.PSC04-5.I4 TaxID=1798213 RepID=UPI000891760C|nr:class I SAM-dependent methyltransferase [Pseudovibrio sp. Tun.PSC04-5.I4]SDQ11832.1 Methyltransferase domain-containing protein [Pseudovibrio sp. Tun.PSC04-5.I4]SDQ24787.1 Methyltransferase domain-containing protein [Pseudovibrio sp. Tun.PSC04-5.I4]
MIHHTIFTDPSVAQFYELGEVVRSDYDFCKAQAANARSILDLGCGTGELTVQLTKGRHVVGLDPATAMLDIARARAGGENVTWIEGDARNFSLNEHFDLVVLTGHSFQFFLNEKDQLSALNCIAKHLSPNGRFIFDTRNPDFGGRKTREKHETLQCRVHPDLGEIESWNISEYDEENRILSFVNVYKHLETGEVYSAPSQIKYTNQNKIKALIKQAGLHVDEWLGEWTGEPYNPASREIIPIGRKA